MIQTIVQVSPGTDLGIVGNRQLIAVQVFEISRLTTHPVPIMPGTFVAVSGVGPKGDSNGSGKTSFLSAISVLLADPQWNLEGNGGKSIAGLLFRPAAAGLDPSQQDSAALHGYVVGVFAEPDHPEQTVLTVWVRIATTSPYLQARWTTGLHVADADSDAERVLQADPLWQALPREGTIGARSLGRQLYGEAPRCLSYLDTPLRPSAPSLLSQEMTKMSPAEIGRALIALAGLTGQLDLEREQRNKALEQRIRLRTAEDEARSARQNEDVQLAAIGARETARSLLAEAKDAWRHYAARQYLDALAADGAASEAIAELEQDLVEKTGETARADAALRGLGTRDDLARQEEDARNRSKTADALAQQLTSDRAVAADRAGTLSEERNRLVPLRKHWKGQALEESAAALQTATRQHLTAVADEEKAATAVTEAEAALARARAGRSGTAGHLVDRLYAEVGISEAVALADVVELDDAARLVWEPRLHGLREAVVVPRERLHEAQAALADEPGTQLVAADLGAGLATQASGDGIRYPVGLQHFMDGLARRFVYHPDPARAEDDALRATVLGDFPEPQVGREAGIRRAARDLRDAQARHETALAAVQIAKAAQTLAKDEDDAAQAVRKLDGTDGTDGIEAKLRAAGKSIAALDASIGTAETQKDAARTALEEVIGLLKTYDVGVGQARRLLKDARDRESDVATRLRKATEARTAIPIEAWSSEFGGTQQDAAQLCDPALGVQVPRPTTLLRLAAERLRDALAAFQRGSDHLPADLATVAAEHAAFADQQPGGTSVTLARAAGPLLTRLQGAADHDRITAARIEDVRNEREQSLGQLRIETGQKEQGLSLTQDMVESVIDLALRKVSQTLDTMTTYGATLEVNSVRPDGAASWEWEVTPKWKRSASGGLISYKESANSAQVKVFAIQLVLAALIADNQTAGRVVILDELGNSLGDVNRRDVLKSISDVAEQQQVTILGTCQDSILSDASDFFGELIWFTHAAASDAYNQPTRIWGHDPLGERVASSPADGYRRDVTMPDDFTDHAPQVVHLSLLVGEAYGRLPVPLAGLPADGGIGAFSVPRKRPDGTVVVAVDRKDRFRPREADLIGTQPVEAFVPPPDVTTAELRWILETSSGRRWATVVKKLGQRAWPVTQSLIRAGGVVVRVDIADVKTWEPRSLSLTQAWAGQAEDLLREIRGLPVPSVARAALLDQLAGIAQLEDEADLLAAVPDDARLREVRDSRTRAGAWTTYEAGLRAGCYWYRNQGEGRKLTEREISAHMLGGSKKWTPEGKVAFQNVMGKPFDVLVDTIEQDILVRGPLRWTVGQVTADAATANPWIGLPSGGIHLVGEIEHQARGVLVIENADALKQVCLHASISDRWLCVWGNGSVQDGIIAFLKLMNDIPIAVWGDLDAYGIQIIDSMALRLGRVVTPVGMSVDLYASGTKYTPKDLPDSLNVARKMAVTGIESLRDLAQAIVATGGLGCEQETLYTKVLPVLAQQLAALD